MAATTPSAAPSMDTIGDVAVQGKVVGFIRPPPDIRAVVNKTAQFVAKNGPDFENKLLSNDLSQKFAFLKPDNPYHAYYKHMVATSMEELRGGGSGSAATTPAAPTPSAAGADAPAATAAAGSSGAAAPATAAAGAAASATAAAPAPPAAAAPAAVSVVKRSAAVVNPVSRALKTLEASAAAAGGALPPPPKDEWTMRMPGYLSPVDIDTLKLTAQFTAVGGKAFLAQLTAREARNPTFDFLKHTHALFPVFTALVDQYRAIANPSPALRARVAEDAADRGPMLARCVRRLQAKRADEARRQAGADALAAAASIDWQDFVVVETIAFGEDEDESALPAPTAVPTGARTLPARGGGGGAAAAALQPPLPAAASAGGAAAAAAAAAAPSGPTSFLMQAGEERIMVRTDYVPQAAAAAASSLTSFMDARSGRAIPLEAASEQMRVELIDPKWRQQQDVYLSRRAETLYAPGEDVADNLKRLAARRSDVFGGRSDGAVAAAAAPAAPAGGAAAKRARIAEDDEAAPGTD